MDPFKKFKLAAASMGSAMRDLPGLFQAPNPDQEEGERLLALGEFPEAEAVLARAAWELKARAAPGARQAKALLSLATAQWKCKKLAEARKTVESAHELLSGKTKPSSDLSACVDLKGCILQEEEDAAGAIALFREALEIQEKVIPVEALTVVERYRRLANALHQSGGKDEARHLFVRALEFAETRLGTRSPATADCLIDLGKCQSDGEDYAAAIASMERAVEIHRETLGGTSEEVACDLQALASVCRQAGDLDKAVKYYEQALYIRERQLGGNAEEFADILMGLADAHTLKGNDAGAMEMLQQAVAKLERGGGDRFAGVLETLGEAYARWGRHQDAVSCYRKARVVWEKDPDKHYEALQANETLLQTAMAYIAAPEQDDSGALQEALQALTEEGLALPPDAVLAPSVPGLWAPATVSGATVSGVAVPAAPAVAASAAPRIGPPRYASWDELSFDFLPLS